MERYVLDCSVAIKWFIPEPLSETALPLLIRLQSGEVSFIAPDTLPAEFGHALRRLILGERLTPERAARVLNRFISLPIETPPSRLLAPRALQLALGHMATFYDALYVALAEREDLKVLTADERMANAFQSLGRTIKLAEFVPPPPDMPPPTPRPDEDLSRS